MPTTSASRTQRTAAAARRRRETEAEAAPRQRRVPIQVLPDSRADAARTLQEDYFGLSIGFQWLSVERALSAEHKQAAADAVHADARLISAKRKTIDKTAAAWQRVQAIRRELYTEWRRTGLPFPVAGVRLFKRENFAAWQAKIASAQVELREAVAELQTAWPTLVADARERLGDTFDQTDYPDDISGAFEILWEIPSLEPPEYLRSLSPQVYREACAAVQARFAEAVTLAESTALDAVNTLLTHLVERLTSVNEDGRPVTIKAASLNNLREFATEFRAMSIGSSAELDALVARVETLATTSDIDAVRESAEQRAALATTAAELQTAAAGMLAARPLRKITFAGTKATTTDRSADQ